MHLVRVYTCVTRLRYTIAGVLLLRLMGNVYNFGELSRLHYNARCSSRNHGDRAARASAATAASSAAPGVERVSSVASKFDRREKKRKPPRPRFKNTTTTNHQTTTTTTNQKKKKRKKLFLLLRLLCFPTPSCTTPIAPVRYYIIAIR